MAPQRIRAVARPALAPPAPAPAALRSPAQRPGDGLPPRPGRSWKSCETDVDSELDSFQFREDPGRVESAKFSEYRDLEQRLPPARAAHLGRRAEQRPLRRLPRHQHRPRRRPLRAAVRHAGATGSSTSTTTRSSTASATTALFLWNSTGPGRFEIADPSQAQMQGAIERQRATNPAGVNFAFLRGLLTPYLETARDARHRPAARSHRHQLRPRPHGRRSPGRSASSTRTATARGPTAAPSASATRRRSSSRSTTTPRAPSCAASGTAAARGVQFGYRYSQFENNISTLIWDNPFRATDATDPNAYSAPGSGSIGGAALGFADLAPDNDASLLFVNGRARFGGNWHADGRASYQVMTQDDPLLPYTLNSAIVGESFDGAHFDPTNPANLPARTPTTRSKCSTSPPTSAPASPTASTSPSATATTTTTTRAGASRFPATCGSTPSGRRSAASACPTPTPRRTPASSWAGTSTRTTNLQLSYELRSWDRTFREVEHSDEDAVKLSFDTRRDPQAGAAQQLRDRRPQHRRLRHRGDGEQLHRARRAGQPPGDAQVPAGRARVRRVERAWRCTSPATP